VRDHAGNLFGTTQFGGGSDNAGTLFELQENGKEKVLHRFHINDGQNPCSALLLTANGDIYGTTIFGGYEGVLFRYRKGKFHVIYQFGKGSDGAFPNAGVIADGHGNLFGTTGQGGTGGCPGGCGAVYKVDQSGKETVLHSFSGPDGAYPSAALIRDQEGNLYGTTNAGGANSLCQPNGCGTVFKIDKHNLFSLLYSFKGGTDGWFLTTGLVRDAKGNLYGTTAGGGTSDLGTIYEITKTGKETVLYSFQGAPDGQTPQGLYLAKDGTLYGSNYLGGTSSCVQGEQSGCGAIFAFNKTSGETILYRFNGQTDGIEPLGPVIMGPGGLLYGTTQYGSYHQCATGGYGCGTIWKLELAKHPPN